MLQWRRGSRSLIIEIDFNNISWEAAYALLTAAVIPRPIAWVSTLGTDGIRNLAPFSFFNAFSASPVVLGFAPMSPGTDAVKDTLANVRATKQFVINIATEQTLEQMDTTAKRYPPDVCEFEMAGLTAVESVMVKPPRVGESPVSFECELFQLVPLGDGPGSATLVLGRAVYLHVADDVLVKGAIDGERLKPVARLGGALYARPDILAYRRSDR